MEQAPKVEVTSSGTSASTAGFGVADPSWDSDPNDMARDALCQAVGDLRVEIIRRGHVEAVLRRLAQAVLDTRNAEARAVMTMENAQANYQSWDTEAHEHALAAAAASKAENALREALATPND